MVHTFAEVKYFVSILTRPRGRVLLVEEVAGRLNLKFQSSPAHVGGCYPEGYPMNSYSSVSILTRPRGRVLLFLLFLL